MLQIKIVEKIKTHILYSVAFSEDCAVYEIILKNMVQRERERPQKIWRLSLTY